MGCGIPSSVKCMGDKGTIGIGIGIGRDIGIGIGIGIGNTSSIQKDLGKRKAQNTR
jgi:hypothetical protein